MSRALAATGPTITRYELARRADADMAERGTDRPDLDRLAELASDVLGEAEGTRTMRRLRRLHALRQLDAPIILIVRSSRHGPSHHRDRGRPQTRDHARHVDRLHPPDDARLLLARVHAVGALLELRGPPGAREGRGGRGGDARLLGFLDQTRNVLVGVEAAIDRSLAEGWSMVLEGVHLVPGMLDVDRSGAIVVQCLVAIEDEDLHRSHFWVRDHATEGLRPLEKYIDGVPEIRLIQDALIERARRCDVPVIMNATLDQAMGEVSDLVLSTADRLVSA